jgi:hypothetical protein
MPPDQIPLMLRTLAAIVECDQSAIPHWPTQAAARTMPAESALR